MRGRCPSCDFRVTQYRLYRRDNSGGKRAWLPVGWMCERCGHLHTKSPMLYIGPRRDGIPTQVDEL